MQGSEADALRTPVAASYARALVRAFGRTRSERDELLKSADEAGIAIVGRETR